MDLDCVNATNIFGLGFSLSAVLSAVASTEAQAREKFMNAIIDSVVERRPQLPRSSLETETFRNLVFAGYPKLTLLFKGSILVRLFAAILLVVSAGTLLQTAHWGSSCTIEPNDLNIYVGVSFVVAPFIYWAYQRILQHVITAFIASGLPEQSADLFAPMAAHMKVSESLQESITALVEKVKALSANANAEAEEIMRTFAKQVSEKNERNA